MSISGTEFVIIDKSKTENLRKELSATNTPPPRDIPCDVKL